MKPSELIGKIFALEGRAAELDRVSSAAARKSGNLRAGRQELIDAIDSGPDWEAIEERLSDLDAGIEADPPATVEPPKPTRKVRADKGQPRTPRPHVAEGQNGSSANAPGSTEDARVALYRKILAECGPLTLAALEAQAGGHLSGIVEVMEANPETFARWLGRREGDSANVELWGTVAQFDQRVGGMSVKSGNRIADTVAKFGCSEGAAVDAWKRLDPGAVDRARREASGS